MKFLLKWVSPLKKYNEQLLRLIETGRIDITKIISHHIKRDDSPKSYDIFDKKKIIQPKW